MVNVLCLIRPPNGITERAREVLALLCNPTRYTACSRAHTRLSTPYPCPCSPQFACIHTDTTGSGIRLAFGLRCWWRAAGGRRLGDLRSDFKLYLGMDRSIYLRGVAAIMHGLTVSVAGKLTRCWWEACRYLLSPLSLSLFPFTSSTLNYYFCQRVRKFEFGEPKEFYFETRNFDGLTNRCQETLGSQEFCKYSNRHKSTG